MRGEKSAGDDRRLRPDFSGCPHRMGSWHRAKPCWRALADAGQLLSGRCGSMCSSTYPSPTEAAPMTGRREAHRYSDCRPATARRTIKLSPAARSLWGKSDHGLNRAWMPLFVHMIDSSQVAGRLWDEWAAKFVRKSIVSSLGASDARARAVLMFLAAVHDIGKATPAFQAQPCSWSYTGDGSSLAWIPEQEGLRCTRASC